MDAELVFAQLKTAGVVVDPSWQIDSMSSEDVYHICFECCRTVIAADDPAVLHDRGQSGHDTVQEREALDALPPKLPQKTRSRVAAAQAACELMHAALGVEGAEYNAILYPEASRTIQILQQLAQAAGEHAERAAATAAEASDASAVEDDEDADAGGRIAVSSLVKKGLASLRKRVDAGRRKLTCAPRDVSTPGPVVFQAATVLPASAFGEAASQATLVAQVPVQRMALGSLLEYIAEQRVGSPAFEAQRKRRLTAFDKASRARRFGAKSSAAASGSVTVSNDTNAESATSRTRLLYGTAGEFDPRVETKRREEAAAAAAVEAQGEAEVTQLQQAVENKRERRAIDEQDLAAKIKKRKQQIADLKAAIKAEKSTVKAAQAAIEEAEGAREAQAEGWENRRQAAELKRELIVGAADGTAAALLDSQIAESNAKRQQMLDEYEARLSKLARKHAKLLAASEELAAADSGQSAQLKAACKELRRSLRRAKAEAAALERDWERCPAGIDRSKFARVVTDMSASLRKQQIQIDDVVRQIRDQQQAIDRTRKDAQKAYSAVEEHVFEQAKQEPFAKSAYPKVIELREAYTGLVETINARGTMRREQHVIDSRHAKLTKSLAYFEEACAGVGADVSSLRDEVAALKADLKSRLHAGSS